MEIEISKVINSLTEVSQSFGVNVLEPDYATYNCYIPAVRKIQLTKRVPDILGKYEYAKCFILAHELGHAVQSPFDFGTIKKPDLEDKHTFVLHVETDAWRKAASFLERFVPQDTAEFWEEFVAIQNQCLESYINPSVWTESTIEKQFKEYNEFIFIHHNNIKPINL